MKTFKRKLVNWMIVVMCLFSCVNFEQMKAAESFSISGPSTVNLGESINISISGAVGRFDVESSNNLTNSTSAWIEGSGTISLNTLGEGTTTVIVKGKQLGTLEGKPLKDDIASLTVNIIKKPTSSGGGGTTYVPPKVNTEPDKRSADNNLAGLSVSQGKLSPDFSAEVTKYRVEAGPNLKEISIDAKATDAKASVSGTGKKELKVGDNSFDIICTAENTVTKTYNVVVHVDEKPLVYLKVNGKELGVVRDLQGISIPEGFNATKIKIKKHEIDAWKNASGKTLVYLMDKKGNKNFYLYDQKKGVTSIYIPITLAGHNLALIDISDAKKDRNDMKYVENILVDNHKIPGWIFNDENKKDFSLHLFMNEKGEKVYYQYDNKENILQRYIETEENPGAVFGDIITYVSIGLAGLFAIAFVVAMMKNARLKKSLTRKTRSLYEPEEISGDNSYEETKNDNKITDENIEN
ncbi:MAG: hypothetical protein RR520_04795 [Erysipelotrichaceae bacterium]